jgi:hypothetical protein
MSAVSYLVVTDRVVLGIFERGPTARKLAADLGALVT